MTSTRNTHAQALDAVLAALPASTSERDRRIRAVARAASDAVRAGKPLSEVADYAAQEVYGYCLLDRRPSR